MMYVCPKNKVICTKEVPGVTPLGLGGVYLHCTSTTEDPHIFALSESRSPIPTKTTPQQKTTKSKRPTMENLPDALLGLIMVFADYGAARREPTCPAASCSRQPSDHPGQTTPGIRRQPA